MSGILIYEEIADETHAVFQRIYDKYKPSSAVKLHIADLEAARQEALRNEIYETIIDLGLPCFWYAIHVAGLFKDHAEHRQRIQEAKPSPSPRFKRGSLRDSPRALLHEELFQGLFCNVLDFLNGSEVEKAVLRIKTDRVDSHTLERFKTSSELFMRFLEDGAFVSKATALDSETGDRVDGFVTVQVDRPDLLKPSIDLVELTFECSEDGVTLAADVLANSLNHLFVTRRPEELYGPLNDMAAVRRHPLAMCFEMYFDLFGNPARRDILDDRLRAHPKAPKLH